MLKGEIVALGHAGIGGGVVGAGESQIIKQVGGGTNDISFTVALDDVVRTREILEERMDAIGFDHVNIDEKVAKVSIVGAGMMNNSGVAVRMFEALQGKRINIQMISSSEIKLSVVIAEDQADQAVTAIHDQFFQD